MHTLHTYPNYGHFNLFVFNARLMCACVCVIVFSLQNFCFMFIFEERTEKTKPLFVQPHTFSKQKYVCVWPLSDWLLMLSQFSVVIYRLCMWLVFQVEKLFYIALPGSWERTKNVSTVLILYLTCAHYSYILFITTKELSFSMIVFSNIIMGFSWLRIVLSFNAYQLFFISIFYALRVFNFIND